MYVSLFSNMVVSPRLLTKSKYPLGLDLRQRAWKGMGSEKHKVFQDGVHSFCLMTRENIQIQSLIHNIQIIEIYSCNSV